MSEVIDLLSLATSPSRGMYVLHGSIDEHLPPFLFWNDDPFELPPKIRTSADDF